MSLRARQEEAEVQPVALNLVKSADLPAGSVKYKILVWGQSGAGKTHLASLAPGCLHLPLESQAIPTVRRTGNAMLPFGDEPINTMGQLYEVMRQAKTGALAQAGIQTLAVDALGELQRMIMDDIRDKKGKNKGVFSKADWGTLANRMHQFLRMLRDLPYHVIVLAHSDVDSSDDTRRFTPLVKGSLRNELAGYFNAIGYAYKLRLADGGEGDTGSADVRHLVMFEAGEEYLVKPFGDLTGVVVPRPDLWFRMLDGEDVDISPDGKSKRPDSGAKKKPSRRSASARPAAARSDSDDDDEQDQSAPQDGEF